MSDAKAQEGALRIARLRRLLTSTLACGGGRAITKTAAEAAPQRMAKLKARFCPEQPPAVAPDGKGAYREAMVAPWGQVPAYSGKGRPPELPPPAADWQYVQVVKQRAGHRLVGVSLKVVYGAPTTTLASVGGHTAYVERANLTSRQMKARLVISAPVAYSSFEILRCAQKDKSGMGTDPPEEIEARRSRSPSSRRRWRTLLPGKLWPTISPARSTPCGRPPTSMDVAGSSVLPRWLRD